MNLFIAWSLAALEPIINVPGHSPLLSWLISLIMLSVVVCLIVWLVTKVAGPPNIPDPWRWILWLVVAIALIILIFAAFGVSL